MKLFPCNRESRPWLTTAISKKFITQSAIYFTSLVRVHGIISLSRVLNPRPNFWMIYNSPAPNNGVGLYFLGRRSAVRYPGESSSNSDVVRSLVDGEPVSIVKTSLETAQQILVADYFT